MNRKCKTCKVITEFEKHDELKVMFGNYKSKSGEHVYLLHYLVCSKCGNKELVKKKYIRTIWELSL